MKYQNRRAFEKHLESAGPDHFSHVYLIIVDDPYDRQEVTNFLVKRVLKDQMQPELSLKNYQGEQLAGVSSVLDELNTLSFFSGRRVIVLQNLEALNKAATVELERYFQNPSKSAIFVLVASSYKKNTTLYKQAEKHAVIFEQPQEAPWQKDKNIQSWVIAKVASEGFSIEPAAAKQLIERIGTDHSLLHSELEKLFCYIGERRQVTVADVEAVTTRININNAWQLGEAIFKRHPEEAFRISKGLLDDGVAFMMLVRQIRSQFQTEAQVCSLLASGGGKAAVQEHFKYMKGNILDRHCQMAQNYGLDALKKGLLAIDASELEAKSGSRDPHLLLELLIAKLVVG